MLPPQSLTSTASYQTSVEIQLYLQRLNVSCIDFSLMRKATSTLAKTPTYAAIDRVRRDVGAGFRRRGPFKDDQIGTLQQMFRALSQDQQGVAYARGIGADYSAARRPVESRKRLDDQAVQLLGKDLKGSNVPKLRTTATGLTRGDTAQFRRLMNAVPEGRRTEVVAGAMSELFNLGAQSNQSIGQGFVSAFGLTPVTNRQQRQSGKFTTEEQIALSFRFH